MKRRSSVAGVLLAVIIAIVALGVIGGGCAVSGYNKAVRYSEATDAAWAQVENVLQRRYDLIPNLVETVKGYAKHESDLFTQIANARTKYFNADTRADKIDASRGVESVLSRLLVLRETYPELKAQAGFLKLQDELAGTENRIAVERMRYNDAVQQLNQYRRSFFGRMFTNWAGVKDAEYFKIEDKAKEAPKVDFSGG